MRTRSRFLTRSLSLSRQPLGEGERLVRFDVNALARALSLSPALALALARSLARSLSLSLSLSLSIATVWQPLGKGERLACFDVTAHSIRCTEPETPPNFRSGGVHRA